MSLTRLETNFHSRFEGLRVMVNQTDPWNIVTDLKAKINRFKFAMDRFEKEKNSIISDLETWKASRLKLQKNTFKSRPNPSVVNQRNKLRVMCIKILDVVSRVFIGTGFGLVFGLHFLVRTHTITAAVAMGATWGGIAIIAVGGSILGVSALMRNTKLSREVRLYHSEDFKDFLRNVVNITSDEESWHQPEQDLLNPNLHKIYQRYKAAVIELPRS